MATALLGDYRFTLDPSSIAWDFTIKASDTKTIGGKVVQVFGTRLGDLTVEASFGKGGHAQQARFMSYLHGVGAQMMAGSRTKASVAPIRFVFPPKKWDFRVYLKAFHQVGEPVGAAFAPEIHAPAMRLTLFIVEDNANIRKVAQDAYISRLSAGLGWKLTAYNGGNDPTGTVNDVQAAGGIQKYLVDNSILRGTG